MAPQEVTVVAAPEKTGLLALRTPRGCESGAAGLGPRLLLGLLAQREPNPVEQARVEAGEHVGLVLLRIVAASQQAPAAVLDDPCVVPGREAQGSGTLREREELREAKAAVAANARIRSLAAGVAAHERRHDGPAKPLAQIERHVRETERKLVHVLHPRLPVSGHARKPRREALALHETNARRGYRLIKQFQKIHTFSGNSATPTACGPPRRSATALSTPPLIATATRPGSGSARNT